MATTTASLWLAKAFSRPAKILPASARPGNGSGYVSARKVVEVVIIMITVSFHPFTVAVTCVTLLKLGEFWPLHDPDDIWCDRYHGPLRTPAPYCAYIRHFAFVLFWEEAR